MNQEIHTRLRWFKHYQSSVNLGVTCQRCGISRPTLRKWLQRYEESGLDGLVSKSRRPRSAPNKKIFLEQEQLVLLLRHENNLGARRIIYDPEGSFVTGGGWIISPEGAYSDNPDLTGRANFDFISKYKNGATTPTGQTELQFQVADLNFHSDNYQWLVVAGARAMYKGTGTINGEGNFGFMLTAIDEKLTSSTDVDMFRIKIWDQNNDDRLLILLPNR